MDGWMVLTEAPFTKEVKRDNEIFDFSTNTLTFSGAGEGASKV